jgi:hypothetical protein
MRSSFLKALWERIYGLIARDILSHWMTEEILTEAHDVARLEAARRKFLDEGNEEAAEFLERELEHARRANAAAEISAFVTGHLRTDRPSDVPAIAAPDAEGNAVRRGRPKGSGKNVLTHVEK